MFWRLLMESFRRQRRRKALAGAAILLGTTAVAAMLALATGVGDRIHRELAVYGANIVVTPAAAGLEVRVGGVDIKPAVGQAYLHEADLEKLKTIFWANNITGVSPEFDYPTGDRLFAPGHSPTPVKIAAMWFDHKFGTLNTGAPSLHPWWKLDGEWPVSEKHGDSMPAVVGAALARRLNLTIHKSFAVESDEARAAGVTPNPVWYVTGIVSTGDETDNELLVPLDPEGAAGNADVSRVEISARTKPEDAFARKDPDTLSPKQHEIWYCRPYANSIAYQIREAIPGARAEQVRRVEQTEGTVLERISGLMWLISAAALLAAGFAVSAAMATAVLERRGEIGLMRSLGAGKATIAMLFFAETGLLAVATGALGYVLGSGLAAWLGTRIFGADAVNVGWLATLSGAFNPVLLPVVVALALVVAIAGGAPAIRAALKLDPSAILRSDA